MISMLLLSVGLVTSKRVHTSVRFTRADSTPTRWILVYAGSGKRGRPSYSVSDFTRLLAVVDEDGRPQRWLCTGVILLELYASSGHVFTTWIGGKHADGDDWRTYEDSLFAPGGVLARLDSAVALVEGVTGVRRSHFPVAVMIPYPDPRDDSLRFLGTTYNLLSTKERGSAGGAYVRSVKQRFAAAWFSNLRLDGFYWLYETLPATDTALVKDVAGSVHTEGLRLLWIPYYGGLGRTRWHDWGFDEAWLQPNYFFNLNVKPERLDSAVAQIEQYRMGLEIEFDDRLYRDSNFAERLNPYLDLLDRKRELLRRPIAIYEGAGALIYISELTDPKARVPYCRLAKILTGSEACQ